MSDTSRAAVERLIKTCVGCVVFPANTCLRCRVLRALLDERDAAQAEKKALESEVAMLLALIESAEMAARGDEPSDFMLSYPEVRRAWDLWQRCQRLTSGDVV